MWKEKKKGKGRGGEGVESARVDSLARATCNDSFRSSCGKARARVESQSRLLTAREMERGRYLSDKQVDMRTIAQCFQERFKLI